jgi:hypothetical protein
MLLLHGCLCVALGQGGFIVWQLAVKIKVHFLSNYMFIHTVNNVSGAAKFVKLYCRKLCFLGGFTSLPSFQDCSNKYIHAVLRIRDPRWKKTRSSISDEHPGFFGLKYLHFLCRSGPRIRDYFISGSRIRDGKNPSRGKHPGSARLPTRLIPCLPCMLSRVVSLLAYS